MNERSHKFDELIRVFENLNFNAICRECRGQCCHMPWLAQDELHLAGKFPDSINLIGDTAFFLDHDRCTFLDKQGKCKIYDIRPLDCRLFPLDIIEQDGEYYWCVFTTCPNWQRMKELLEPLIPLLEEKINSSLWQQFSKQIAVTKEEYMPYKNGQYVTIKRFARRLE